MRRRTFASVGALVLALAPGCFTPPRRDPGPGSPPPCQGPEGPTIRVKAPPQKIVIEQPECGPPEQPGTCRPEPAPEKKDTGRRESTPREQQESRPQAGARPESALGTLAALGEVASFSRTLAMTRPLGTVNPGASALGLSIQWIRIPIPFPRIFAVEETPSVTVPLSEANLQAVGYGGVNMGVAAGRGPTREEIAALVARELAARQEQASHQGAAPACPPRDDPERRDMEKKLSEAEAKIEKLTKILKSLDDKLPAK